MSGRKARQWRNMPAHEKILCTSAASLEQMSERHRRPKPPAPTPSEFPLKVATYVWYPSPGVMCCLAKHEGLREEGQSLLDSAERMVKEREEFEANASILPPALAEKHDKEVATLRRLGGNILRMSEHYSGYVVFPRRFLRAKRYEGIVTYVPVHGGITWAEEYANGAMCYGFDSQHAGDDDNPNVTNLDWAKAETEKMMLALRIARRFERRYVMAKTNRSKSRVLDAYQATVQHWTKSPKPEWNFGEVLNVMSGKL